MPPNSNYAPSSPRTFHKAVWTPVQNFRSGDLSLDIEESDHPQPRYRFRIGKPYEFEGNNRLGAIQPHILGYNTGNITLDNSIDDAMNLLEQAEIWILQRVNQAIGAQKQAMSKQSVPVQEYRRVHRSGR